MKSRSFSMIFLIALMNIGCTIAKIPFKYSSLTHGMPSDMMTQVGFSPEDLSMKLSDAFRQNGGVIVERKKINTSIKLDPNCEQCWKANHDLAVAEFQSYKANSWNSYQSINREEIFKKYSVEFDCKYLNQIEDNDVEIGYYLAIDINNRSSQIGLPSYTSFFGIRNQVSSFSFSVNNGGGTATLELRSRIKFWFWKNRNESMTRVYVESKPVSGEFESGPGVTIGYLWWKQITGESEHRLAKHFLLLLEEMEYKRKNKS